MALIPWGNSGKFGVRGSFYFAGLERKEAAKEASHIFFPESTNVGVSPFILLLLLYKVAKKVNVLT